MKDPILTQWVILPEELTIEKDYAGIDLLTEISHGFFALTNMENIAGSTMYNYLHENEGDHIERLVICSKGRDADSPTNHGRLSKVAVNALPERIWDCCPKGFFDLMLPRTFVEKCMVNCTKA